MKLIPMFVALFGIAATPELLAQGCCEGGRATKEGCTMMGGAAAGNHSGHGAGGAVAANAAMKKVFMEPVQSAFDNYIKVQGALAQDSLEGVSAAAGAIAKAVQGDSMKMLPQEAAPHSEALSKAKDLETARAAFKPLSESLIQFVKGQKAAAGVYHEAYCPMAKASWLQTGKTVMNPYMGKSMVHCGQLKT